MVARAYQRVNSCIEAEVAIRRNRDQIHTSGNSPSPLENAARSVSSGSGYCVAFDSTRKIFNGRLERLLKYDC